MQQAFAPEAAAGSSNDVMCKRINDQATSEGTACSQRASLLTSRQPKHPSSSLLAWLHTVI